MNKFELVFDLLVAFILYGLVGTIGGFFALLMWAQLEFEILLRATIALGLGAGVLGAAIPILRRGAVFVLSLFTPSLW
ncbi:MAG: hypothetical protein NXH72_00385 [Hyphomonadaceae bacterium]|nr:hypothetical protein [Hyphomonadaceae bacterium]